MFKPVGFTLLQSTKVDYRGFTLVELLVTISIIAVLSLVGITVYTTVQNSARTAATRASIDAVYKAVEQQRILQQQILKDITGSTWTAGNCGCAYGGNCTFNDSCKTALRNIYVDKLKMESLPLDGWGDPILLDENERDPGWGCAQKDWIWSVHISGKFDVPFFSCP